MKPNASIHILMIEDSTIFVNTIKSGLMNTSHLIQSFAFHFEHTLEKGLAYIKNHPVDVILVDLSLPDSEKWDTLQALKKVSHLVPIIVISDIEEADIAKQSFEFGVQDYLIKKNLTASLVARTILHSIERKQLLDKLEKNSEKQFSDLIEANEDALIVVNNNKTICYANKAAEKFLNGSKQILIGLPFTFPLTLDKISEITIIHPNQRKICGEMKVSAINWENEPAFLASIRDITQFKKIKDLKASIKEKEKFNQLKSEFLGTVSHELRNPLTIVKGAISNLSDLGENLTDPQTNLLSIASRNLDRIHNIIKNFLELSRLDSRQISIEKEKTNIMPLIHEAKESLEPELKEKNITLTIQAKSPPPIYANQELLIQVFLNLLSNAIKYTKNSITIAVKPNKKSLKVSVSDNGPGLSKEAIDNLFKKFVQVNRDASKRGYQGTGLGLSICNEILTHHNGSIYAESTVGKGASFIFELPLYNEEEAFEDVFKVGLDKSKTGVQVSWIVCYFHPSRRLTEQQQMSWKALVNKELKATPHITAYFDNKRMGVIQISADAKTAHKYRFIIKKDCLFQGLPKPNIGVTNALKHGPSTESVIEQAKKDSIIPSVFIYGQSQEAIDLLAIDLTKNKCRVTDTTSIESSLKKMHLHPPDIVILIEPSPIASLNVLEALTHDPVASNAHVMCLGNQKNYEKSLPETTIFFPVSASASDILKAANDLDTYKL